MERFHQFMPCTPVGSISPSCPAGWNSKGNTPPGSCSIGNAPGYGPLDVWKIAGYNKVCQKNIKADQNLAVECCSGVNQIQNSIECKKLGFIPYSDKCNNVMQEKCNAKLDTSPFDPVWDGMPNGLSRPIYSNCTGKLILPQKEKSPGTFDLHCFNYLANAPANNFYKNHNYIDYPHEFPRYSFTTPQFDGTFGYKPMRQSYHPYHEYQYKINNLANV